MQERPLAGKVAIVTGAASPMGLGRVMTEALVRAGARVSMMDINPEWLGQSSNDLREIGGDDCVMTQVVDVTSPREAVARTIAEMGGLHILSEQRRNCAAEHAAGRGDEEQLLGGTGGRVGPSDGGECGRSPFICAGRWCRDSWRRAGGASSALRPA